MNDRPALFSISATDRVMHDACSDAIVNDLLGAVCGMSDITMTCYRAGCPVTELLIQRGAGTPFCLTIWQGAFSVPPVSDDDLRLSHKEISLPDTADALLLTITLARHAGLNPYFGKDVGSSSVLRFSSK